MTTQNADTSQEKATPAHTLEFERVLRECPRNETLKRDGATRGFLYDFKAFLNGQHIAWWTQYGPNGEVDTRGFRYWLEDKTEHQVHYGKDKDIVAARNRKEFADVLLANLHRIPTDDEIAKRKLEEERKEQNRREDAEARDRKYRMEQAAPDLAALLLESRESIGGDWRERRDAILQKAGVL